MKLRTFVKIAITTSVSLLCTGFVLFSFFRLSAAENKEAFELYTLVPSTANVVFETDDMCAFIQEIDKLNCSRDSSYLYVSKIFSDIKLHLNTLLEETPHGLSRRMSKMLLSFHEPDNERNQVLYCALDSRDYELIERFVKKCCSSTFPSKLFDYKGEEIRIYPLPNDDFLACYVTTDFLVVSYQKKLIEQVIDARFSGKSLLKDESFFQMHTAKKNRVAATIYSRMESLNMGKMTDGIRTDTDLGCWTEFDMKLDGDVIYFSGVSHDTDTCLTFMNMLRRQQPMKGFSGAILPVSTFFFSQRSVSDLQAMFDFTSRQAYATATCSAYINARDEAFLLYLKENGVQDIMTCLFHRSDSVTFPAAIASLPVDDAVQAERMLKVLIGSTPEEKDAPLAPPVTHCYASGRKYTLYVLPRNTLFAQLTGITQSSLYVYASFYEGRLLLAPDSESLSYYILYLSGGEVLEELPAYKESISGLSDRYNFMLVADLGNMFTQPEGYVRLVPSFFFRHPGFFRHFVLSAQFAGIDGQMCPNIVLQYKEE